ncbi:MAG TPA: 1,2-phenylacetyl-CoA epoxidase subunit PaaD [Anaerolineae bacterium]|nr:1,2-phenylacetyl-CoA epoxidase subunit PaaD [Anaerolineae bacterium]
MTTITTDTIWEALQTVKDPEIPVVSVIEMGIVREVTVDDDLGAVHVKMTPTFSGCPALDVMRRDIETAVRELGVTAVTVETILTPPWTSDWITEEARVKLKAFGLAPPPCHGGNIEITFFDVVPCPRCDSKNTSIRNTFGSTLCRAIYYCNECQDAFEQFKPL